MIESNQIKRIVDLFKNKISLNDLKTFNHFANQRYNDRKEPYGNSYNIDEWVNYFENKKDVININRYQIELIFKYLKDFYSKSVFLRNEIYILDKNFPHNIKLELELVVFQTLEFYLLENNI